MTNEKLFEIFRTFLVFNFFALGISQTINGRNKDELTL